MRNPPSEEEGVSETTCGELTVTSIPCPPVLLAGRRSTIISKSKPGKKGVVGKSCFKMWFYFSLSQYNLIGNKLIFFLLSQVWFAHGSNWRVVSLSLS